MGNNLHLDILMLTFARPDTIFCRYTSDQNLTVVGGASSSNLCPGIFSEVSNICLINSSWLICQLDRPDNHPHNIKKITESHARRLLSLFFTILNCFISCLISLQFILYDSTG